MQSINSFKNSLLEIHPSQFNEKALELFIYQARNNEIYSLYLKNLRINPESVTSISEIPFLPVEFFKTHSIKSGKWEAETFFSSSGTTGQERSIHWVRELEYYETVSKTIFERKYGSLSEYIFLALLPSYQENRNSSLIYMIDHFMRYSSGSSCYVKVEEVKGKVEEARRKEKKIVLWGVSYALLDLAEQFPMDLSDILIIETGGMKGRRQELIREELHGILINSLKVPEVHSEYGMTELLSQAYASKNGIFSTPSWMKVLLRELSDPFSVKTTGKHGGINIIDLANVDSCSFLETKDIGTVYEDTTFEVLGRMDNSEIRGCNLLYALS